MQTPAEVEVDIPGMTGFAQLGRALTTALFPKA